MKLSELLKELQEKLDKGNFADIREHGEFHERVKKILTPLPEGFALRMWNINEISENTLVFAYDRDFIKDGRTSKYNEKGKFSNVRLNLIIPDMELQEVKTYLRKIELENIIKCSQKNIIECKLTMLREEQLIDKYLVELRSLNK